MKNISEGIRERVEYYQGIIKFYGEYMVSLGHNDDFTKLDELTRAELVDLAAGMGVVDVRDLTVDEIRGVVLVTLEDSIEALKHARRELRMANDVVECEGKSINEVGFDKVGNIAKYETMKKYSNREKVEISALTVKKVIELAKIVDGRLDELESVFKIVQEFAEEESKGEVSAERMVELFMDLLVENELVHELLSDCYEVIRVSGPELMDLTVSEFMFVMSELKLVITANFS